MSISRTDSTGVPAPLKTLLSRDSLIVAAALAAAAILAWGWLLRSSSGAMTGIGPPPLSAEYLLPAFVMWAIMMVAMMVPSAAPMILLHARVDKAPTMRARQFHTLLFTLAYLLVWTAFAAAAALTQALLAASGAVSAMTLSLGEDALAAGLLLMVAVFEITSAKGLCLEKCQAPMLFILTRWKPGAAGAFRLGVVHGLYCLGCCWALMLLLFVGGVMNLAWVALLAIIVLGEKYAPSGWHAERYVAAVLTATALLIFFG